MSLGATILFDNNKQGTDEWHAIRRGRITGSRAKDAREKLKGGGWSQKAIGYAYDVARQRLGGKTPEVFSNQYMRAGTENEPVARMKYEGLRGVMVEETGFAYTTDGKFGCSPDGLIAPSGLWECKTMVSSATLFNALVTGDVAEYRDQCLFEMWLLRADWVDLTLFCPDLELMRVVRIERNEEEIETLVADMMTFDALVETCAGRLREAVAEFSVPGLPDLLDHVDAKPATLPE
jgi:exodeoxyribonuclease (lambda-induced)